MDAFVDAFHTILDGIMSSPQARVAPPSPGPFTSDLGVVNDYIKRSYGDFKVDEFHFAVDCTLGSSCLFWYTFAGSLRRCSRTMRVSGGRVWSES